MQCLGLCSSPGGGHQLSCPSSHADRITKLSPNFPSTGAGARGEGASKVCTCNVLLDLNVCPTLSIAQILLVSGAEVICAANKCGFCLVILCSRIPRPRPRPHARGNSPKEYSALKSTYMHIQETRHDKTRRDETRRLDAARHSTHTRQAQQDTHSETGTT